MRQVARTAPPTVRLKGAPRERQASPRVLAGAGAVVLVVVIAIVLGVVLTSHSSSTSSKSAAVGSLTNGLTGAADVNTLFKGIPQTPTTLGRPDAPVTMTEYIDLQCPACQSFATTVFPTVVTRFVRTGKLKVIMRPWAFIGPDSVRGQAGVLAAGEQSKAFNYAALLYDNQGVENSGWLNSTMVSAAAASIPGFSVRDLESAVSSESVKTQAKKVDTLAKADNVNHTPTVFVGKSGTRGTEVATDEATLVQAIQSA